MINKVLKTINLKWNWEGDIHMLKGFNIALMSGDNNPVDGLTNMISYASTGMHSYNTNNEFFEYSFPNLTIDNGVVCTPWIQALFINNDSEWVSLNGAIIEDDGNATIVVIGNPTFQQVIDMSDDNKITPQEKLQLKKEWDEITADHFSIYVGIIKANLDSEELDVKAYITAVNNLAKYFNNNKIYSWIQINDPKYTYPEMLTDNLTTDLTTGHYGSVDLYRERIRQYYETKVQLLNLIEDTIINNNNDLIQDEIDKNTLPSTIAIGGYTSCEFIKNKNELGNIRIDIGSFNTTTGHKFPIDRIHRLNTNLSTKQDRVKYILFVGSNFNRFNIDISETNDSNLFIIANHKKGQWYYYNGLDETLFTFEPAPEDCVVARIDEYASIDTQEGIESIKFYASTSNSIFDSLTDGGKLQGIFTDTEGRIFINGEFIKAHSVTADKMNVKGLVVTNNHNENTFEVTSDGEVNIKARSLQIIVGNPGTGVEEGKDVATEDDIAWKIDLVSSNGIVFKNGLVHTELSAIVFKGKDNMTDELNASQFKWIRTSDNPEEDLKWNQEEGLGVKKILITKEDIYQRATFSCELSDI